MHFWISELMLYIIALMENLKFIEWGKITEVYFLPKNYEVHEESKIVNLH